MTTKSRWKRNITRLSLSFLSGLGLCLLVNAVPVWVPNSSVLAQSVASSQLVQQGIDLYQLGKFTEAIALWQKAIAQPLDSKDQATLHSNLAQAYRQVGKLDQAIAQWQQSIKIYQDKGDESSRRLVAQLLTEQGQTYSDLGQHQKGINLLQSALEIARKTQDKTIEATAEGGLGNAYWALGEYEKAIVAHETSLKIAREQQNSSYITTALNNLANVYVSRAERYRYQENVASLEGDDVEEQRLAELAKGDTNAALKSFQESLESSKSLGGLTEIRALLNFNRMLVRLQTEGNSDNQNLIASNRQIALTLLEQQVDSQDKAYALINIADSLKSQKTADQSQIIELLEKALTISKNIGDPRAESFALGTLGQVYESNQQYAKAMELTRQSQFAAQTINAADSLYRWQWQTGRILKATGQTQQAIASYEQAIATLQSIRGDILAANKELQFNFRDSVEPVYRELIGLLLDNPDSVAYTKQQTKNSNKANIQKVVNILELLKLAELQNFFGDDCVRVALETSKNEQIAQGKNREFQIAQNKAIAGKIAKANTKVNANQNLTDPKAAIIYSVILDDRSEMILQLANGALSHYSVPLNSNQMQLEIDKLRALLEKRSTDEYIVQSQKIYNALIRPLEADISAVKPETLVFVQDSVLRKVPMSALHDGKQFLIEKYAIATTPSLSLTIPKASDNKRLNALVVGLTVERPPFDPLPNVKAETTGVEKILGGTKLLDQDFTVGRFEQALRKQSYPIVHMATHGKFGVDNDSTFLLGFDSRISIEEIDNLLRSRGSKQPVELLTLSACQTAAGDNRSALGIAGVAVRAGVKSALATLWFINDESTVPLVEEFYTQLRQPGITKAEALRKAQLKLIAQAEYNHPAVWSPFILIGNWL